MNSSFENLLQHVKPAIPRFLRSIEYAEQLSCDHWDFALEIQELGELGLDHNDLRWLIRNKIVEHRQEITALEDRGRIFRDYSDLTFGQRSCFVLTSYGIEKFRNMSERQAALQSREVAYPPSACGNEVPTAAESSHGCNGQTQSILPNWDPERRVLGFNGLIVKRFKWNAMNQQAILIAFEEEGWPARIFDPLPPQAEQDTKRRLSDTIKCLNRKQCHPILHFRGDGTGEGVIWESSTQPVATQFEA